MGCERKHSGIVTGGIAPVGAQFHRIDPVSRAGLMQGDKWIGIVPVATGPRMLVHDGNVTIWVFVQQRIDKCQPNRACANDEIIGFKIGHLRNPWVAKVPAAPNTPDAGLPTDFARCN